MKEEKKPYFATWEDWYESEEYYHYGKRWANTTATLMAMVYRLRLNCSWACEMFERCRDIEVLKHIIIKCRDYLDKKDRFGLDEEDCEEVRGALKFGKEELFRKLNGEIFQYCVLD